MKKKTCVIWIQTFHYVHKTDDIYKDIAEDVETRFDSSNCKLERPLPKEKNKKDNWINEIRIG